MRIEKENQKNPKSEIRDPKYPSRCFFRAMPLLPSHKLAFAQAGKSQKRTQQGISFFALERKRF